MVGPDCRQVVRRLLAQWHVGPGRADLVLAAIPLLLVLGTFLGILSWLSLPVSVGVGSLFAATAIGYVLFFDPPQREANRT